MHERDQLMGCTQHLRGFRQYAEGKTVDHDRAVLGQAGKLRTGVGAGSGAGPGKSIAEIDDLRLPTEPRKLGDDPPVIGVAAGGGCKIAGDRKHHRFYHRGASYQARATGDSATATRTDLSARPSRPSLPARPAAAI